MADCVCVCVHGRVFACVLIGPYLKQGHVLAVVLLALLGGSIAAVDEGAALLGVTVTWRTHKHTRHLLGWTAMEPDMS